jgi:hypothetical protein
MSDLATQYRIFFKKKYGMTVTLDGEYITAKKAGKTLIIDLKDTTYVESFYKLREFAKEEKV